MTGATAVRAASVDEDAGEIQHVLDGVVLRGAAFRLGRMLERGSLDEAGWDPRMRMLLLPDQHRLLGRPVCRVGGCGSSVRSGLPGVCQRCFTRLTGRGLSTAQIAAGAELPAAPVQADRCAVSGCERRPTARRTVLCTAHAKHIWRSSAIAAICRSPGSHSRG
ncbi:MAG: hypothetical protein LC790_18020 [Actinobacteria bacterium]|nr:hypothetical protein [Actinomycetota bacterium]